jgi:uncharacterized membrane protein
MPHLKKCIYVNDLLAVTFISCLGAVFVLTPPFNETFLRILLALPLFFFIPGYAFISALFPRNKEISGIERFTLSVGFSLILTVFDGFLISQLPWGYRPTPIVISIIGITTFFSLVALFTRKLLDESEQFSFSINDFLSSLKSDMPVENTESADNSELVNQKPIPQNRRFHRSRSKVESIGLKYQPKAEIKQNSLPPEIEKVLIIALVGSIIIASGMLVFAKMTQEKETYTMLYLLGQDGKAEGYPTESYISAPLNVTVGIENHELQDVNYVLRMKADEEVIEELNFTVKNGDTWQRNMTYTRQKFKTGRSKLEFALFKDKQDYIPYRSAYLYIENNNTLSQADRQKYTEIPVIENGNMESSAGWDFISNSDNISGSYVNGSGVDSSSGYRIVNSYEGNLFSLPEYGKIYQNIECKENTMVTLSAYVKSDYAGNNSNSSSQVSDNQAEQVTVNGETVWMEMISGSENWKHFAIPITLQAGSNNLTFGLNQTSGEIRPVEVSWDSVSLTPLRDLSYVSEDGTLETVPPTSSVLELPNYTKNTTFTVSWNGTDDSSGIAYYLIDTSTDGINWKNWIPKTTDNSSVFTGENNLTYYFRSKAIDNAGNEEPVHQKADAQTKVYSEIPQLKLDISPNPCKNATVFTVTYPIPLKSAICIVTPDGFESESIELKSTDGVDWTGGYTIKYGKHFYVEAICIDINGNTTSAFDELTVDNSVPDFVIEISPKTIDNGDLEIKVTPSTALRSEPSVSITANKTVNVTYISYSDGAYYYKAKIDTDVNEGEHEISVGGSGIDSKQITGNSSFVIRHSG